MAKRRKAGAKPANRAGREARLTSCHRDAPSLQGEGAAGFFDLLASGSAGLGRRNGELLLQVAGAGAGAGWAGATAFGRKLIPRSLKISSLRRSWRSASSVALTTFA